MPGDPKSREPAVSADAVRGQLQAVLRSQTFSRSPILSRFLKYVVDKTLEGQSDSVKEYSIGVEVFRRGDSFDPRTDTIVRAQARRLRQKLGEYYAAAGHSDSIVIEVPKGSYVPCFRSVLKPQSVDAPGWSQRLAAPGPSRGTVVPQRARLHAEEEGLSKRHRGVPAAAAPRERHMVGREKELATLKSGLQQVLGGQSLMLAAIGEAGIGKTTLVEAFLDKIDSMGELCAIARGQCSERLAGTEAYLPVFDVLNSLLEDDRQTANLMRQQAPWWYAQVAFLSTDEPEDRHILDAVQNATQERVKRELAYFLQEISASRPLLIFIEDLHWADVSTIDMLAYLGARFDAMRLLIVTTYRPTEMALADHPFLRIKPDLLSRGLCREVELRFLTPDDIERYLSLKYSEHKFPSAFSKMIHQQTEGSPLFVVDLVRDLEDRGVVVQDEQWRLAQPISDLKVELPDSVKGMIQRKIGELNAEDHRLLATASVQGFTFDSSVLARMLALDEEAVEQRLQVLESDHRFVQLVEEAEFPDRTLTLRYRFVHVLYQNELYASLTSTKRTRLSRTAAEALERFYGERSSEIASELAPLYETARDFSKAVDYFGSAAEHAMGVFAFQEAVALANRGLALLRTLPKSPHRDQRELDLQITLGSSATAVYGYADKGVGETYFRLRELVDKVPANRRVILSSFGLHSFYLSTMEWPGALDLCEWYLDSAEGKDDLVLSFFAHTIQGVTLYFTGDFAPGLEHLEKAISLYHPQVDEALAFVSAQDVVLVAWNNYPWNLWLGGYPDQAIRRSGEAGELAQKRSNPHVLTHRFVFAGFLYLCLRDTEKALEFSEANISMSKEHGFPWPLTMGLMHKGWAMAHRGKREEGLRLMHEGLEAWRVMGFETFCQIWHAGMAEIYGQMGQPEKGLKLLEESLAVVDKSLHRIWEAELHRVKGELLLLQGEPASEVESCYEKALKVARRQQGKSFELRAAMSLSRLWQQQGRRKRAHRLLTEIYGWFTEGFDTRDLQEAKGLLKVLTPS